MPLTRHRSNSFDHLVFVQDFMNGVCTNVIHLTKKRLQYYGGNYDAFIRTKLELEENQQKRYQWEQDQIAHMKVF